MVGPGGGVEVEERRGTPSLHVVWLGGPDTSPPSVVCPQ